MPCDAPPPPSLQDFEEDVENDVDELMYDFVADVDILQDNDVSAYVGFGQDDSVVTFTGHKKPVFCCQFDKNRTLAVSGSQDEKAFVWYVSNGETKFECPGHSDSVISTKFNHDSSLVATADMAGVIQVWDVNSGNKVWNFDTTEILWLEWQPNSNFLVAGCNDGNCWKWSIPDGDTTMLQSHGFGATCGKILPDGSKCAVGYANGSIKCWDMNQHSIAGSLMRPSAHKRAVNCLESNADGSLILTGSEDGDSKLIKSSDMKMLWNMQNCFAGSGHLDVSVESVGFFQSHPFMATGTTCGCLSIWDITSQTRRSCKKVVPSAAIVKLICGNTSPVVYIGSSVGEIALYDTRSEKKEKKWYGHEFGILDFDISSDFEWMLSSGDDNKCKIFKLNDV